MPRPHPMGWRYREPWCRWEWDPCWALHRAVTPRQRLLPSPPSPICHSTLAEMGGQQGAAGAHVSPCRVCAASPTAATASCHPAPHITDLILHFAACPHTCPHVPCTPCGNSPATCYVWGGAEEQKTRMKPFLPALPTAARARWRNRIPVNLGAPTHRHLLLPVKIVPCMINHGL